MQLLKKLFFAITMIFWAPILVAANSPAGTWTTIDDKTGQKRAVVQINVGKDGTMTGTIVKVFPQPGDTGICSKCPGDFKNKKIQGLQMLWGLKKESDTKWSDGEILDPKNGKIYRAQVTWDGDKLKVRGYMGVSLFGRTQVWVR